MRLVRRVEVCDCLAIRREDRAEHYTYTPLALHVAFHRIQLACIQIHQVNKILRILSPMGVLAVSGLVHQQADVSGA